MSTGVAGGRSEPTEPDIVEVVCLGTTGVVLYGDLVARQIVRVELGHRDRDDRPLIGGHTALDVGRGE